MVAASHRSVLPALRQVAQAMTYSSGKTSGTGQGLPPAKPVDPDRDRDRYLAALLRRVLLDALENADLFAKQAKLFAPSSLAVDVDVRESAQKQLKNYGDAYRLLDVVLRERGL